MDFQPLGHHNAVFLSEGGIFFIYNIIIILI